MQRRLGNKAFWELVSFTGKFSIDFLTKATNVDAPQPDVADLDAHHSLKAKAVKCRGNLRWAESLNKQSLKKRAAFSMKDNQQLKDLHSGKLLRVCNDATKAFGHGRIRHEDGHYVDIGPGTGGLTRTILDHFVPPIGNDQTGMILTRIQLCGEGDDSDEDDSDKGEGVDWG